MVPFRAESHSPNTEEDPTIIFSRYREGPLQASGNVLY